MYRWNPRPMLRRDFNDLEAEQPDVLNVEPYPRWAHEPMRGRIPVCRMIRFLSGP